MEPQIYGIEPYGDALLHEASAHHTNTMTIDCQRLLSESLPFVHSILSMIAERKRVSFLRIIKFGSCPMEVEVLADTIAKLGKLQSFTLHTSVECPHFHLLE
jgi:hypothetical protein